MGALAQEHGTHVPEARVLFSYGFFGSHLVTTDLYATDKDRVYEAAKRYYAEIMMPFRKVIQKNLDKVDGLEFDVIAPSNGPIYDEPRVIQDACRNWVSPQTKNEVVPYVSMHGSTYEMVMRLTDALVDAATLVVGTPTVHVGPHPAVYYAAIVGSYGWSSKAIEQTFAELHGLAETVAEAHRVEELVTV